jgi:hypothetical protein
MSDDLSEVNSIEIPTPDEDLPIAVAVRELAPDCRWSLQGMTLAGLVWEDDISLRPSDEAILTKAREIKAEVPWNMLRKQRDARMREVDWVTLRAMRTGEPIPDEWKAYMQTLADITETQTPILVAGRLTNVVWPTRPDGVAVSVPGR